VRLKKTTKNELKNRENEKKFSNRKIQSEEMALIKLMIREEEGIAVAFVENKTRERGAVKCLRVCVCVCVLADCVCVRERRD
jgi:hypothetical protein